MTGNRKRQPDGVEVIAAINRLYDNRMYDRLIDEYYGGSGFLNFGYWDEFTHTAQEASEELMEKLLALATSKTGNILDVACGTGATTKHLLKYYSVDKVVGINISEKQLRTCRNKLPDCALLKMDAAQLGFADESFDNVRHPVFKGQATGGSLEQPDKPGFGLSGAAAFREVLLGQ